MNPGKFALILIVLMLTGTFGYVAARKLSPDTQELTIRTYSVASGRAEEIKNVLSHMFSTEKNDGGAQVFGKGVLVVKGSEAYQTGIARLIELAAGQKGASNRMIHIDYWLVRGEDSKDTNSKTLPSIQSVLETINQAQGSKKFALLEHLGFSALDRREIRLKGAMAEVKSIALDVDGQIELRLETKARSGLGELKIDTQVKPGEYVILGQNAMQPHADEIAAGRATAEDDRRPREIYHIVRAEFLP